MSRLVVLLALLAVCGVSARLAHRNSAHAFLEAAAGVTGPHCCCCNPANGRAIGRRYACTEETEKGRCEAGKMKWAQGTESCSTVVCPQHEKKPAPEENVDPPEKEPMTGGSPPAKDSAKVPACQAIADINPGGKKIIFQPGAFRPPHAGHFAQVKTQLDANAGAHVVVVLFTRGVRHGITAAVSKNIWNEVYRPILSTAGSFTVVETKCDPHEEAWAQCEALHTKDPTSSCIVVAGPDRASYKPRGEALFSYLHYQIPTERLGGDDVSATSLCKDVEAQRTAGKTKASEVEETARNAIYTKYFPSELTAEQKEKFLNLLLPVAKEAR